MLVVEILASNFKEILKTMSKIASFTNFKRARHILVLLKTITDDAMFFTAKLQAGDNAIMWCGAGQGLCAVKQKRKNENT